ncbi:uncharacterized protein LOC114522873 [Dendronephthya gigantea]|uniref:uncharacterized protein LOC114522873 n=1 Tax=Dendronephthya gigantea TaxID=151771 RepID=UPI00106AB394|nr:uncharacterized protein LOC114522873 [Dendronephthya gigantea]
MACWVFCCEDCAFLISLLSLIGFFDCLSDWMVYHERAKKIEDMCEEKTEVHGGTKMALIAMFVFAFFGTILFLIETINSLLSKCKVKIFHPVILSIVVCIVEEMPLAGLRWNLRISADKKIADDGWGIAAGIFSIVAPLLGPISKCLKMSTCCNCCNCCNEDDKYCFKLEGRALVVAVIFLFLTAGGVAAINAVNWKDFNAPGSGINVNGTFCA